jgi:D-serine deaminase-like pyridoxal phosphate-dependent protein
MQLGRDDGRAASAADTARGGSGLATAYHALDDVVARFALRDAALVVDVPSLGRQVLHAGRRPLHNDEQGLHDAEPGLYLDPPVDVPLLAEVMVAMTVLGLRLDAHDPPSGTA